MPTSPPWCWRFAPTVRDADLQELLALAFGNLMANAATGFRPCHNGQPVTEVMSAIILTERTFAHTLAQVSAHTNGLADFEIPFQRGDSGEIELKPFDLLEMLGKAAQ